MGTIVNQRPAVGLRAAAFLGELLRMRHLVASLAWRDVRVRYVQSFLGVGWAVALPIVTMLVFVFVFTRAVDGHAMLGIEMPYALYAYTGIVPWTFFATGLATSLNSLVANRNLVTKAYFPREVFPLSSVFASSVDFVVGLAVLVALMFYLNQRGAETLRIGWTWLLVPVLFLIQFALTVGLGMILALANLFYRDVRQVFGVLLQLAMFFSAVVVPIPRDSSRLTHLLAWNPMAVLLESYRECLVLARMPSAAPLAYVAGVSLVVLVVGWSVFRRMSPRFAECV